MARKNLVIREDVDRKQSEVRKEGESFGDVIEKLPERGADLLPLWGVLSDSKHWTEIENSARASFGNERRFAYDSRPCVG